jgi:hypothetical protein
LASAERLMVKNKSDRRIATKTCLTAPGASRELFRQSPGAPILRRKTERKPRDRQILDLK